MRQNDFILKIQEKFDVRNNRRLAESIANAMEIANDSGLGTFVHDGVLYKITAVWKDGCYKGDCNPATCYTSWELDS